MTTTSKPLIARKYAALKPAGPAPTIPTLAVFFCFVIVGEKFETLLSAIYFFISLIFRLSS